MRISADSDTKKNCHTKLTWNYNTVRRRSCIINHPVTVCKSHEGYSKKSAK